MEARSTFVDITPEYSTVMGGFIGGNESQGTSESIEANIVTLRESPGSQPLVLVSVDLLYPGRVVRHAIEALLPNIEPDRIFLAASHTHNAPMTDDTKVRLGQPDPRYVEDLTSALATVFSPTEDANRWCSVRLAAGAGTGRHSINRRRKKRIVISKQPSLNAFVIAPNPQGATDERIEVLAGRDEAGIPIFVMWNYACHPVAFPDTTKIAGHFPHVVRRRIREMYANPSLPVLYFQGFSGDTRPSASVTINGFKRRMRRILTGPVFSNLSWAAYGEWAQSLAVLVADAVSGSEPLSKVEISTSRQTVDSSLFLSGAPEPHLTFHAIRFGDQFCIAGASAEVVSGYAPTIRARAGARHVMCVGCIDHTVGYIPTKEILDQGGYEGGEYCEAFGLGSLEPDIERQFLGAFASVLER